MKKLFLILLLVSLVSVNLFADDTDYSQKWQTQVQTNQSDFQKALDAYNQAMHTNEMVRLDKECQEIQAKIEIVLGHLGDPSKYHQFEGYVTEFNRLTKILNKRIEYLNKEAK
jgi:peptidoglycan hydrolase CwlO-like protein